MVHLGAAKKWEMKLLKSAYSMATLQPQNRSLWGIPGQQGLAFELGFGIYLDIRSNLEQLCFGFDDSAYFHDEFPFPFL